jgi:hypothetical protein
VREAHELVSAHLQPLQVRHALDARQVSRGRVLQLEREVRLACAVRGAAEVAQAGADLQASRLEKLARDAVQDTEGLRCAGVRRRIAHLVGVVYAEHTRCSVRALLDQHVASTTRHSVSMHHRLLW